MALITNGLTNQLDASVLLLSGFSNNQSFLNATVPDQIDSLGWVGSGYGVDLIAGASPNGLYPAIRFTNGNLIQNNNNTFFINKSMTVMIAAKRTASSYTRNYMGLYSMILNGGRAGVTVLAITDDIFNRNYSRWGTYDNTLTVQSTSAMDLNTPVVVTMAVNPDMTGTFYTNASASGDFASSKSQPYFGLGGLESQNEFFIGDMYEVLVYNRALTQAEVSANSAYLVNKWFSLPPTPTPTSTPTLTPTPTPTSTPTLTPTPTPSPTLTPTPTPTPTPELLHVLLTGQSNARGTLQSPVFTTAPAINGLMFNGGMSPGTNSALLSSFIPLQEVVGGGVNGETGMVSLVNWLSNITNTANTFVVSNVAVNAATYAALAKGTTPYSDSIAQISAAKALAISLGFTYRVLCVIAIHGEQDEAGSVTQYKANLLTWQNDYNNDIKAITGQSETIRLYACQQGVAGPLQYNSANLNGSSSLNLQSCNVENPTLVINVGPETHLDFYYSPHFTSSSHAWLGEQFAKAIYQTEFLNSVFAPIIATSATIIGSTIVVDFSVPVPPLRLDYRFNAYTQHAGFRFDSSDGTLYPTSVVVSGPSQLTLNFSNAPSGTGKRLGYALDNAVPKIIRGSNIADSDASASLYNFDLGNRLGTFYINM